MRKVHLEEKVLKLTINTAIGICKELKKLKFTDTALHCKFINVRDKSYNFVAIDAEFIVFGLEIYTLDYTLKDFKPFPLATLFFLNDFVVTSEHPLFSVYMYNSNYELEQVFKSVYGNAETFTSGFYVTNIISELHFLLDYNLTDRTEDAFDWEDEHFNYCKCTLKSLVSYCKYVSTLALPNNYPFVLSLISAIEYTSTFKGCISRESDILLALKLYTTDYFNGSVSFIYKQDVDIYYVCMHNDLGDVLSYHRIFKCDMIGYSDSFMDAVVENLCFITVRKFHTHPIKED